MRWTLITLVLVGALGCRSQSTPLTNPFLAPDRVPPPATQTLAPGTAQPYYPGDPLPSTPIQTTPGAVYPPAAAPPATFTPATTPVTPPGGWGQPASTTTTPFGVQPTSGTMPINNGLNDDLVVRINPDDHGLRFAAVPNNNPNDIIQVAANQQLATSPYVYTPPIIQQQNFTSNSQTVSPTNIAASDGFRPQGSSRAATTSTVATPTTTPPVGDAHFGYDPTYRWLRGQLQYYPQTGYWGLRYIGTQAAPDPYGGVVVIYNTEVLSGVQPGEYLLVQGFLETQDNGDGTFVPLYTIEGIQRQR